MKKHIHTILILSFILLAPFAQFHDTLTAEADPINREAVIEIGEITGGFGRIQAEIKNVGNEDIGEINWFIQIEGGLFGNLNRNSSGTIFAIPANGSVSIRTNFLFGLGKISITINVNGVEKTINGFLFLFFIKINPELTVQFETIASGLNSPVGCTHAGDGTNRLFIYDQIGKIYVVENNELLSTPFLDISSKLVNLDTAYDERGLLGLTFHPEYSSNGRFYVYYSSPKTGPEIDHETILAEYQVSTDPNIADPASENIIMRFDQPEANHNGGQIAFGPDSYLYLGLGDGGGAGDEHGLIGNGQNINTSLGSIIRIDVDSGSPYAIPPDNPFVGTDGLDEIYAYGFRNPWRFSFDTETDELFVADVGQDEWEEIDIVTKGENYGWRIMEASTIYDQALADLLGIDPASLAQPIHEYNHNLGRSITGGYVYRGTESQELIGSYVFGDWSSSFILPRGTLFYLQETEPDNWQRFELQPTTTFNRFVTSFGQDQQGELYVCSKTTLGPTGTTGDVRKLIVD